MLLKVDAQYDITIVSMRIMPFKLDVHVCVCFIGIDCHQPPFG
jgi:hypothetical protein